MEGRCQRAALALTQRGCQRLVLLDEVLIRAVVPAIAHLTLKCSVGLMLHDVGVV